MVIRRSHGDLAERPSINKERTVHNECFLNGKDLLYEDGPKFDRVTECDSLINSIRCLLDTKQF